MLESGDIQPNAQRGGLWHKPKINEKTVIIRDEAGQILHCVIGLWGTIQNPRYEKKYFSADNPTQAAIAFRRHFGRIAFSFVMAAPAIGFFVHDNHGDSLSADGTRPVSRGALDEVAP